MEGDDRSGRYSGCGASKVKLFLGVVHGVLNLGHLTTLLFDGLLGLR
jgi:hypothetical protein